MRNVSLLLSHTMNIILMNNANVVWLILSIDKRCASWYPYLRYTQSWRKHTIFKSHHKSSEISVYTVDSIYLSKKNHRLNMRATFLIRDGCRKCENMTRFTYSVCSVHSCSKIMATITTIRYSNVNANNFWHITKQTTHTWCVEKKNETCKYT